MAHALFFVFILCQPLHASSDLEEIEALEKARRENHQKMQELVGKVGAGPGKLDAKAMEKFKKMSPFELAKMLGKPGGGEGTELSGLLEVSLKGFRDQSEGQVVATLKQNLAQGNGPLKRVLKNPKHLHFLAKVLRDKLALPSLARIPAKRKSLGLYAGFLLVSFLVGYILKKSWEARHDGLYDRLKGSVLRFSFLMVLRLSVFVFLFYAEFLPFIKLLGAHYF